jgi:hypothetical protein
MAKRQREELNDIFNTGPANRKLANPKSGRKRAANKPTAVSKLRDSLKSRKKELTSAIKKTKNDLKVVEKDLVSLRKTAVKK